MARNGPEFEEITKQKQQNNPKFEFLYGGEYSAYYQYRVTAEQSCKLIHINIKQGSCNKLMFITIF